MSDNTSYYDLYKALKADGAVQGDWNSFHKFVGASGKQGYLNRKQLYDALKADGAVQSNSYEEFHMKLYRGGQASLKAAKQRQVQQQTQQQPSKPQTAAQMAMAQGYKSSHNWEKQKEDVDYLRGTQRIVNKPLKGAPKNASPFVKSLYEINDSDRAYDDMQTNNGGHSFPTTTQGMIGYHKAISEDAAKKAADMIVNDERRRRDQPIVKTETPADEYVVKTQGQWENEISDAADQLVNASGDFIKNSINNEYKQATLNAEKEIRSNDAMSNPFLNPSSAALISTQIANKYESPDKILSSLQNSIKANINNVLPEAEEQAIKLGVPSDVYLENVVLPKMIQKAVGEFQKTEIAKRMPKNDLDYFVQEATSSNYLAKLGAMLLKTKSQRQFDEEALARTNAGANPNYNPGTALRIAADVTGMATDPIFGASAKLGGAVVGKVIGNGTKIGAMMANGNLAQRLTLGGAQAVTSGGVTGFAFDSVGSAIQNYSTGEDTSLGNTLKVALNGGLHGAANFATMSAVGVPLGQIGRSIGMKSGGSLWGNTGRAVGKIGLEAGKTYMEGMGMYLGSYVTGKMDGATDANGKPIEFDLWGGTMESLPTAIGFRLQHAIGGLKGGRKDKDGNDMGWAKSTLVNMKEFLTSDKEKSSQFMMTDDERSQIMHSYHDTMGHNKYNFDNVVTVAKDAKKKPRLMRDADSNLVKFEEEPTYLADVESDMEVVHNVYSKIMADPNVSWDAKAKFSAMVTGIMPSARPMVDHYRFENLNGSTYMKEYSANGELLSEREYKNPSERDAAMFKSKATKENLRLYNSAALLNVVDRNNADMQDAFFQQKRKEGLSEQEIILGMSDTKSKIFDEFADFCYENGSFMKEVERTAAINDVTVEYILREMEKDPMKRDEMGQEICTQLRQSIEATVFSKNKVHEEQSQLGGKDVAEENGLGTEKPNGEAVRAELSNLTQAEDELEQFMKDNDVFGQNFENLQKQGLTNPQIYDWMVQNGGLTEEQLAPFANYINANARVQGMQNATQQMIEQKVSAYVQDWSMHGTLNGEKQNGEQAVWVQDGSGRTLVLGSGDVAFDSTTGRAKEGVGDMIICLDPNKGEMVYLKAKDVTLFQTQKVEDFGNEYRQKLQQINSLPYEQAAREQAEQNANKEEGTATQATPGQSNEGAGAVTPNLPEGKGTENNSSVQAKPIGKGAFGDIYDGFKGKVKEAFDFLTTHKSGDLLGVFHRDDVGDIDLVWGDENMGLAHILSKHIGEGKDFASQEEAIKMIEKVINEGNLLQDNKNRYTISFNGFHVGIRKDFDGKAKKWIVTAVDYNRSKEEKGIATNPTSASHGADGSELAAPNNTSAGKDTNNSPNGNENNTTLTFADGSPVPMKTDSKGRPTPDYENMTAEQSAEVMQNQFGESAEKVADARIKKAEKAVKDAEKMKVDYSGEDADILEQQAVKDATIAAAHAQLKKAKAIKEALNKPKDSVAGGEVDTAGRYEQERKQGYRIGEGNVRYDRQKSEEVGGIRGKEVEVAFSPTEKVKGHAKLVELDTVQGSHSNGILNPYHFGPDWQPKDRGSQASKVEATKMAANIDPLQITGSANAFIGSAPSVNERHETIQGNNRVEALKQMYSSNPEQAAKYKQWLIDHAAEFGLNPEDIAKMKKPVIVNELPVDDAKAKELGQMMASGFESGGKRIPEISATINKLGDKVENLANVLLAEGSLGEDAKLSDLINQNANRALEYLYKNGFIDNTEYENLSNDPTTRRQWLENVLKTSLFDGDKTTEAAFNSLPGNAQKAVLATFMRDMNSSKEDRIKPNIQKSFEAFNELNQLDTFKNAKDVESARAAIQAELLNGSNNMYGETPIRDKYTNFELELAALYKGLKSQKELSGLFGKFFDAVQGATRREGNVFEQGSTEPLSKDEAIEKVFGTDNKLANDRRRETEPPASSGEGDGNRNGGTESESEPEVKVKKAVKRIATEITKQTGIEVVTDEQTGQNALEDAEATDSNVKYHKETDEEVLNQLNSGETIKVYRAMQVIDGKLYPPMAASVGGKLVEANELGQWIRADENPDLAIPDIDKKTGQQKVDPKTGELKWKFKLDKGGKDATGKKATDVNAAYNPYWHMSRSPLNDQFKSAWIRPNIVVVECEAPVSELTSGYKAERAKDAVGEVDWKSGSVSSEVFKQTGRARKVILSRWCKPVRVLDDAEVAERAKEFVGEAKVEIPENVLTPKQRIAFEEAGFKIGAPEKGVKKSEQIAEAIEKGLQIDNSVKEAKDDAIKRIDERIAELHRQEERLSHNTDHGNPAEPLADGEHSPEESGAQGATSGAKVQRKAQTASDIAKKIADFIYNFDSDTEINADNFAKSFVKAIQKPTEQLSDYVRYTTEDGERIVIRLSDHSGNARNIIVMGRKSDKGYSIVIRTPETEAPKGKFKANKWADVEEYVYDNPDKQRLGNIAKGLFNLVDKGEYVDLAGADDYHASPKDRKEFRSKNGEVYGFVHDGKIYLDTKKMKPETPLHEYTHLWTEALKNGNPKEWENVKKLFDEVEGLKEEVEQLYPELKGDDLYEEMITTYSGREGAKKLEETVRNLAAKEGKSLEESSKAKGFIDKVKDALKTYWKGVADMLGIHFTSAEEVADKVLADWASGVNPKEVKAKEEPSKDPMQGIKNAAESYHEEKLDAARKAFEEAKALGDESEIKRTRDELKHQLDEKYKAQGMGLVQRRKEIAKEIGKAEAEKIEKPWAEMDGEERLATAEKSPLTEDEIRTKTSEENQDLIEDAIDYLNGDHGFAKQIAYLKIYEDVRNRHENAPDDSGAKDGTQLDAADTTGGKGLGLGTGRESGGVDEQLDRGASDEPSPRESERREGNQADPALSTGEPSDKQGEGAAPDMGAVPTRGADTEGSGTAGKDGNKPEQGGRGSGNRPAKPNAKRKPTAKQGTTWRGRTESEIKQEAKEAKAGLKAALAEMMKRGRGEASLSLAGLNSRQIEYVPELMKAVKRYGMSLIDQGIYKIKDWMSNIREGIHEDMKAMGFSDQDIDDFIDEMWNSKMTMDGETHTIAEWAGIYGNQKLREKLKAPLNEKYQKQMEAEPIEVKVGDRKNIEETLPFLLPQQQEDVLKAETQFFGKEHTDREHAYGKGYMFTNGTGTGKTYTGLGIAKRLAKQGKGRILFVTPSQPKVSDWIKDGKNLGLNIRSLEDWAKERGTTATTESGDGMVITTYANMRANKKILETEWDAVIYDESHRIMENKKGAETAGSMQHYMVSNRDENHCFLRLQTINSHYQKMRNAADRFDELRKKEVERIQKEYKKDHPGATTKDVINATHSKLPRDLNSFTTADAMTFPKLGKAYQDFVSARQYYYNNVEPKLKEQAKNTWKNTKTVFLSATPFNTRENLDYAEGYIFKYPEDDGSRMSGRSRFYLDHFGAAYRYRYNRLEAKTDNPEAIAKQEIAFSDYLQHQLGTMSGRIIDSPYDYSRDFPTVAPDHAEDFNNAVEEAVRGRWLGSAYSKTIGNYVYGSALFETMKVANTIDRIKQHLDAGRKVVVFHRRVETKEPIKPPFSYMLEVANEEIKNMKPGKERNEYIAEVNSFREKYADLLQWEKTLDYSMPREQLAKVFGKDNVLFFSGKESAKTKSKAVDTFNDDNSGKNIIVIQEASGKEGISLHDVTGNHQRVLITLGLPQSPITALQIEGRTYRIGNKSNAIFEYPILGLNSEMMLFGEKFNNQVSTTENLALGSQARNLRDSFAKGVLEHSGIIPIDQQGVGGKEFDAPTPQSEDPYGDAILDYYSNQKLNRNNREGQDYFPTPEPLGYKMVEWANMGEGDTALEPSAGHGAIARYVPKENQLLSIEPSQSLFTKLQLKAGGLGRKFLNNTFEKYDIINKHDVVVMNPPFGTAGATAIAHLDKAFKHLDEGGRVVAIIPRGSTDKKFDKWYDEQKNIAMRAEVDLPDIVFQQAGTNVRCRVVVLDKITDAELRGKAGYPEKIDLSGHYDKIEDFFEDLRDVQIPDRIIDTQMKTMKKARGFKKELESIKGISVSIEKNGISVFDKNVYRDYSISFPSGNYPKEKLIKKYASNYEIFDQTLGMVYNENSKAALEEMKRLTCKLADMSEEEMQKYISDKKNGSIHFREERGVQYSSSDGSKDVKNGRIIPSDVDNSVSSQIEKKFDDAVENETKGYSDAEKADFNDVLDLKVREFSNMRASDIENQLKAYEYDYREWSTKFGGNGNGKNLIRRKAAEYRAATIAAERELDYRKARAEAIRDNYGLQGGRQTSIDALAKIFEKDNRGQDKVREGLFQKASSLLKKLGTEITVNAEAPDVNKNALGSSGIDRDINLYLDTATRTSVKDGELATTILHEMIHQATNGAINLVKKGKAEGLLTPKQIEGVNTILDIYNKVKDDKERFKENTYGLKDEYELTAQMADPRQRKAMDLSIWDRVTNAAREFARKGDRSILQRLKDAVKKLFEVSDKDKMDKAINDIMDDFNETVDDISMNEIDKDGFSSSPVKISDKAPVVMKRIVDVSKKIGGKVNMVNSVEEITNKRAKEEIEAGKQITGWYDEKTGKVHLYMPNIHDSYTAEKTIWHEVVGHKGMRELFGKDRFDKFLRSLWYDLDKPENASLKKLVDEERKSNPLNIYDAIEEGVARLAEEGHGDAGFWVNIKNKVSNFFREIGYHFAPNTKDVKYLLWLSKNLQKNPNDPYYKMRAEAVKYRLDHEDVPEVIERNGILHDNDGKSHDYLLDLSPKDYEEATDGKVHFRTSPMAASKIEEYNRILGTKTYAFKESTVDNMQSLQEAMKLISGEKKVWENIPSAFNPLQAQNRISSVVQQKADAYDRKITKPLDDVFQKVVSATGGKDKDEKLRNAQLYMVTKHGLERNRVFFVRDAIRDMMKDDSQSSKAETLRNEWTKKQVDLATDLEKGKIRFDEYLNQMDEWICDNVDKTYVADEHDYSGFHGLQGKDKADNYDDKLAIDSVMSAESQLGDGLVKDFWAKKKAATDFVIEQEYANGFIDKGTRDYLKGMFQWYVPLRKFDEATAEDVYGYITDNSDPSNNIGSVLANAKGRTSLSDINVLAQISAMAKSSLINGGKNVVKQHFARFVSAYETGNSKDRIFVEVNPWLEKHTIDGNEVWEEATPQIPDNATQEQIADILQDFENDMQAKKAKGNAKLSSRKADIGFKFQRAKNKSEHIVDVYIAGKKRSFVCQGNPRAAQALNGLLVDSDTRNKVTEFDAKVTRKIAQFNTSYNSDFMMSNMFRDLTFASANVTKEGFGYTKDFLKEYGRNVTSFWRPAKGKYSGNYFAMYSRYRNDKLDMTNEHDKMFKEFMDNGGQTGFVSMKKLDDLVEEYNNLIKSGNKNADKWLVEKLKNGVSYIEAVNEIFEGIARYSTYCTSRKRGRSIGRSIYDAKEVSTNFNRHGSGDAIKTLKTANDGKNDKIFRSTLGFFNSWMKNHTQFYNAGVQGANLFFKNYKTATKTALVSFGVMPFGLGLAQALINQFFINKEDKKKRNGVEDPYAELPEWKRRNNICIYTGHGNFETIPIAIELRAFFGLGDILAGYIVNDKLRSNTPIGLDILGQMAQLVPASDFLGHHAPSNSVKELGEDAILAVAPTTTTALFELGFNRDWTGRPIYRDKDYLDKAPMWKSAYDNTSDIYMTVNKWANKNTNGIDSSNEDMKGNATLDYLTAPFGWQHVVDSYTGGMGSTIRRAYDTGKTVVKGVASGIKSEEGFGEGFEKEWSQLDKNQIPLYRVFSYTPSEGRDMQRTKSKWYNYTDELKQTEYNIKQWKPDRTNPAKNVEMNAKKYDFLHGKEGQRFNIWQAADKYISKRNKLLKKVSDPDTRKAIEEDINRKMQEAVNDLDKLN